MSSRVRAGRGVEGRVVVERTAGALGCIAVGAASLWLGGCAHVTQHDVPTSELHRLEGYRAPQQIALRDRAGEYFQFDQTWVIDTVKRTPEGPAERRIKFASIERADETRLEGTLPPVKTDGWVGNDASGPPAPMRLGLDLSGMRSLHVIQISPPIEQPRHRDDDSHPGRGFFIGGAISLGAGVALLTAGGALFATSDSNCDFCFGHPIGGLLMVAGGIASAAGVGLLIAGAAVADGDHRTPQGWARMAPAVVASPTALALDWKF
jgi:hypothetical protein